MPPPSAVRRWVLRINQAARNASDLTTISFSLNPQDTIQALKRHKWTYMDLHHLFLFCLLAFAFTIAKLHFLLKFLAISAIITVLLIPITSQFFLPFLPIATWLIFFFSCRYVHPRDSILTTDTSLLHLDPRSRSAYCLRSRTYYTAQTYRISSRGIRILYSMFSVGYHTE